MANTTAAKKDIRQTLKRTARNNVKRKAVKEAAKAAMKAVEANAENVQDLMKTAYKAMDKAAKAHVIHPNKAARMKSRLQKKANNAVKTDVAE